MSSIQRILYYIIGVFIVLAIFFEYLRLMEVYSVAKITTSLLIFSIPFICGHRSMVEYTRFSVIGIGLMVVVDFVILFSDYFYYALALLVFANLAITRAFLSFKGYTFNFKNLLALLIIAILFCGFVHIMIGQVPLLLLLYICSAILVLWQGLNLYTSHRSQGNLFLFLILIAYLIFNLMKGYISFIKHDFILDNLALVLYWTFTFGLAHTTTISIKKYR